MREECAQPAGECDWLSARSQYAVRVVRPAPARAVRRRKTRPAGDLWSPPASGPILSTSTFSVRGQVCVVRRSGASRCRQPTPVGGDLYMSYPTISRSNVKKGRFTAFAKLDGKVLAHVSLPVWAT